MNKKPEWGKKQGFLLKRDLLRIGKEDLKKCMDLFFEDKVNKVVKFVKDDGAGYTYGVFHSQLDSLLLHIENIKRVAIPEEERKFFK